MRCLVAGAGGFIGGHLTKSLLANGMDVRAVDIKPLDKWWQVHSDAMLVPDCDLRHRKNCMDVMWDIHTVFNLAADMGGIGFIETNKSACMLSVLINTHLLMAAQRKEVKRYFYSSSACVYHADRQRDKDVTALAEDDAYYNGGAMPEDGYGWEKLFSERMCRHFMEDHGLQVYVARFHNIYGPHGSWYDGREKAPAAICRKVAEAKVRNEPSIEIWGDGTITRSFCYIDDCIDGILRLVASEYHNPINIGSSELVSINDLVGAVIIASDWDVETFHDLTKPQGVSGRNSDNTLIKQVLGWEPKISLLAGIQKTYPWIERQVHQLQGA